MDPELRRAVLHARRARRVRPARIETPGPGQESVWDYPRPPRIEPARARVRVEHDGRILGRSDRALRVVETAGAPVYYLPPGDVRLEWLIPSGRSALCEWKGVSEYLSLRDGTGVLDAAFRYPDPFEEFAAIRDFVAFFPARVACFLGAARALPQPGGYYAGWVTPDIVGPIKGLPGSEGW